MVVDIFFNNHLSTASTHQVDPNLCPSQVMQARTFTYDRTIETNIEKAKYLFAKANEILSSLASRESRLVLAEGMNKLGDLCVDQCGVYRKKQNVGGMKESLKSAKENLDEAFRNLDEAFKKRESDLKYFDPEAMIGQSYISLGTWHRENYEYEVISLYCWQGL